MKEKQWFEEWFDSPYYHILYANRSTEEAEQFITRIAKWLNIAPNARVLDVACGKGRHSLTLAKLGFDVTGIDLSRNSIEYAKQFECPTLRFEVWDMRKPYHHSDFDFVFNLFSSFGYFDDDSDDLASVKAFAENLKPGGTLIIDYINTECVMKVMKSREIVPRGDIQFHIEKKLEKGFIKKKIGFLADGVDYNFEEQLKVINLYKFKEMLKASGLELTHTFGDYDLSEFNGNTPRLILIAKKV